MSSYNINFIALNLAGDVYFGFFFYNTFTQLCSHLLYITAIQIQFSGNLFIGQIQAHEVQTQDPNFQRLMMACKDSVCQIVKSLMAVFTFITLTCRLFVIKASFDNMFRITKWALYSIRPAQFANSLIALNIIYQIFYSYLHFLTPIRMLGVILPYLQFQDPKTHYEPLEIL